MFTVLGGIKQGMKIRALLLRSRILIGAEQDEAEEILVVTERADAHLRPGPDSVARQTTSPAAAAAVGRVEDRWAHAQHGAEGRTCG